MRCIPQLSLLFLGLLQASAQAAVGDPARVTFAQTAKAFPLAYSDAVSPLVVDSRDWPGVQRAVRDLQADVERVASRRPPLSGSLPEGARAVVLVGTIGRSELIDQLVVKGSLDVSAVKGKWEATLTQVVRNPFPGIDQALVIAGSDKRGTLYGIYDLSQQIGVSPWYWWADVPVVKRKALYVKPEPHIVASPTIKYRGIFLNDEAPALTGWAREKFGGLNSQFYAHVFELILRLRGNYLWPAMWGNAFNEDDPENARLADEYGIVMGTSHHEPMLRAQQEWKRHGQGAWNYQTNAGVLSRFWTDGIRRNRAFESIVTLGMRGDGDEPMSESANVALLERIVSDQRTILARELNTDVTQVPQLWALYKEVQEYYEKGMRVPDDVTLLWCDDNWGNIRRLPTPEERKRPGGAGVYYHFDYVGGPRSYKWLNTNPIPRIWEQMHLAWQHGADRIWIVNVGDLKPMEFPIEFFLTYAWAPDRWPYERITEFGRLWAAREFGAEHATEIAALMAAYAKFNARRKPESLSPETFSLVNYNEAQRVIAGWDDLIERAARVRGRLGPESQDAFFQLIDWPIRASAIVNALYVNAALNRLYALQGRAATNSMAQRARELFQADEALTRRYNEELGGGRWRHFADQTHLGYTLWQQPPRNVMPAVSEIQVTARGELGVALEGDARAWPPHIEGTKPAAMPQIDPGVGARWIEVFNRGREPVSFSVDTSASWLKVTPSKGEITSDEALRLTVSVDWKQAPMGHTPSTLSVRGSDGARVEIAIPVLNPATSNIARGSFVESDRHIAIEAPHYTRAVSSAQVTWKTLENFGNHLGGVTPFPVTTATQTLTRDSPRLEYRLHTTSTGDVKVELSVAPTLAFAPGRGLRVAVSFDDDPPHTLDLATPVGDGASIWATSVLDNVRRVVSRHELANAGAHVLKVWMIDPGVVLERVVVDFGGVRPSYLGPPEARSLAPMN